MAKPPPDVYLDTDRFKIGDELFDEDRGFGVLCCIATGWGPMGLRGTPWAGRGGWAKSYYHSCLSVTEGQWLLVRLGPNPTSGPRGPSGPHGSPWLGTRLPKTTDRFKKIPPKIQNWCLTFGQVVTLQTSLMVFHKIGTDNTT